MSTKRATGPGLKRRQRIDHPPPTSDVGTTTHAVAPPEARFLGLYASSTLETHA